MKKRNYTTPLLAIITVLVLLSLVVSIRTSMQVRKTDQAVHDSIGHINEVMDEVRAY